MVVVVERMTLMMTMMIA